MISIGKSGGSSSQSSYVWDQQIPFLTEIYGLGKGLYEDTVGPATQFSAGFVNEALPGMMYDANAMADTSFLGDVKSGTNLGMTGLAGTIEGTNPAMQTMEGLMNPTGNPYLQSQIDQQWSSIGRNLNENILPAQRGEESVLDQYGGSRGAISEGMAMQEGIQQGSAAEQQMRYNAYTTDMDRALSAAAGYGGLVADASGAYTGAGLTADQAEMMRLSQTPEMINAAYNLGMTPYGVPFDYLGKYSTAVGGPTVLGQGGSSQSGFNFGLLN